jgi:hypothetical protein
MPQRNDGECARCGGRLEQGFSRDTGHGGMNFPQVWIPGKPQFGWLGGLKVPRKAVKAGLLLEAWRCPTCKSVEWFAREPASK